MTGIPSRRELAKRILEGATILRHHAHTRDGDRIEQAAIELQKRCAQLLAMEVQRTGARAA